MLLHFTKHSKKEIEDIKPGVFQKILVFKKQNEKNIFSLIVAINEILLNFD